MTGHRLPRTLFGGRMRTSTALLGVAFIGVLLLWLAVRPDPATITEEVVRVRTTRTTVKDSEEEKKRPAEVVRSPTATPTASPTPSPSRPATSKPPRKTASPIPTTSVTPGAPGLPEAPPAADETPGTSPAPERQPGLFGLGERGEPRERSVDRPSTAPTRTD